jgi:hypothetical protein
VLNTNQPVTETRANQSNYATDNVRCVLALLTTVVTNVAGPL